MIDTLITSQTDRTHLEEYFKNIAFKKIKIAISSNKTTLTFVPWKVKKPNEKKQEMQYYKSALDRYLSAKEYDTIKEINVLMQNSMIQVTISYTDGTTDLFDDESLNGFDASKMYEGILYSTNPYDEQADSIGNKISEFLGL